MITLNLVPDKEIDRVVNLLGKDMFPILAKAVQHASVIVRDEWRNMIDDKSTSPQGWKRKYKMSVEIQPGNTSDGLSAVVGPQGSNEMFANFVEKGIRAFDMKPGLVNGPHARINAKTKEKFNIVHFRKGVPGTQTIPNMPEDMYEDIQESDTSIEKRMRVAGTGGRGSWADVKNKLNEKKYTKGYHKFNPAKTGDTEEDKKREVFAGMIKSGSKGHSSYGTFRVVTMKSKGWKYPGVTASPVFEALVTKVKPIIHALLKKEVMEKHLGDDLESELMS